MGRVAIVQIGGMLAQIGERRAQLHLIGRIERQPPEPLAHAFPRRQQLCRKVIIGGEKPGEDMAQPLHHRIGQRRQIDDHPRFMTAGRKIKDVGQNHPALAIGVIDFDRLARHRGDDVAGLVGTAREQVFGDAQNPHDMFAAALPRQRQHRADHGRGPAHVGAHAEHLRPGLDAKPARVETDPLADQRDGRFGAAFGAIAQGDHPRLARRAHADGQNRIHPQTRQFVGVHHLDRDPGGGKRAKVIGEIVGMQVAGRKVHQIARERHPLGQRLHPGERGIGLKIGGKGQLQREGPIGAAHQRRAIIAQPHPMHERGKKRGRLGAVAILHQRRGLFAQGFKMARKGHPGPGRRKGGQRLGGAKAQNDDARRGQPLRRQNIKTGPLGRLEPRRVERAADCAV